MQIICTTHGVCRECVRNKEYTVAKCLCAHTTYNAQCMETDLISDYTISDSDSEDTDQYNLNSVTVRGVNSRDVIMERFYSKGQGVLSLLQDGGDEDHAQALHRTPERRGDQNENANEEYIRGGQEVTPERYPTRVSHKADGNGEKHKRRLVFSPRRDQQSGDEIECSQSNSGEQCRSPRNDEELGEWDEDGSIRVSGEHSHKGGDTVHERCPSRTSGCGERVQDARCGSTGHDRNDGINRGSGNRDIQSSSPKRLRETATGSSGEETLRHESMESGEGSEIHSGGTTSERETKRSRKEEIGTTRSGGGGKQKTPKRRGDGGEWGVSTREEREEGSPIQSEKVQEERQRIRERQRKEQEEEENSRGSFSGGGGLREQYREPGPGEPGGSGESGGGATGRRGEQVSKWGTTIKMRGNEIIIGSMRIKSSNEIHVEHTHYTIPGDGKFYTFNL